MDDRTGRTRAGGRALRSGGDSRVAARAGRAVPTKDVSAAQLEREAERAERRAATRAAGRSARKKSKRSHSAVGAAIVAGAAMVATFAFILTNGGSSTPQTSDNPPPVVAPQTSAPPASASPSGNPAPAASTVKADRKPPVAPVTTAATTTTPNTGPQSPVFRRGQWIAVIDKYPTDAGMEADQLAKQLAGKMIAAGVPARAMLLNGQYPGVANSNLQAETGAWVVYLGPFKSAEAALNVCQEPKTQQAYGSLACPTYEPAAAPG
ncbi:SPOR domain-containing protein [Kribbella catacumbae]|uniref:SPOR domain-containing protein n=1 Tax=Kribbella catacumbae TaxID=460086 RepID=UPI000476D1E4|nr:SPOR domain-containing protein [Kribbella catacumbae]